MAGDVQRIIAFGEPRLDADLASILAPPDAFDAQRTERLLRQRLAVEAILMIVAAIILAQALSRGGNETPRPRGPIAAGPVSTPPGGILPAIRNGGADQRAQDDRDEPSSERPARAKRADTAAASAPRPVQSAIAPVRAAPERIAAQAPVRRAGPRRTVGFPATAAQERRETLIVGVQSTERLGPHGPRHHRKR